MDILACTLLRNEAKNYQLKYAFAQLKAHKPAKMVNLSFRDQQAFASMPGTIPSVELDNRELYLGYMEEVLRNKEKELNELEQSLNAAKHREQQEEANRILAKPLELTRQSQMLSKNCELLTELLQRYSKYPQIKADPTYNQLQHNMQYIEETCQANYEELKQQLLRNHQELVSERQQLGLKLSKLQELQSYEKYLTELQKILEEKQYNIIQQESNNKRGHILELPENANQTLQLGPDTPQYNTFQQNSQQTVQSDISNRKRARIFEARPKAKGNNPHQLQSSKIMQERSTQDYPQTIFTDSSPIPQFPSQDRDSRDIGVQSVSGDQRTTAANFIDHQYLYLKFIKLWLKNSAKRSKGPTSHVATMMLYRWRLNALYDEGIKESAQQILSWPSKLQNLGNVTVNYAHLTLRKQKYLEQFFDFERRKFQRQKILNSLKYIIKNRNKRERIAAFLYFKKFREVTKIVHFIKLMPPSHTTSQTEGLRQITTQHSQNTNFAHSYSRTHKESRLQSSSSGYIQDPMKHSNAKSRNSKQTFLASSQVKVKGKQNGIDVQKLKEYIKNQEEVEARLAIECARTEATHKMAAILKSGAGRLQYRFVSKLVRLDEDERVQKLERAIGGYQFKWQLFMAKARLALTSNSNKVSHLQQLISFVGHDR